MTLSSPPLPTCYGSISEVPKVTEGPAGAGVRGWGSGQGSIQDWRIREKKEKDWLVLKLTN